MNGLKEASYMKVPVDIKINMKTGEKSFSYESHSYEEIVQAMHLYKACLTIKDIFNIDFNQKEQVIYPKEEYPEVLNIEEAAKLLKCCPDMIRRLKRQHQLEGTYFYVGRRLFFRSSALENWISNGGTLQFDKD